MYVISHAHAKEKRNTSSSPKKNKGKNEQKKTKKQTHTFIEVKEKRFQETNMFKQKLKAKMCNEQRDSTLLEVENSCGMDFKL